MREPLYKYRLNFSGRTPKVITTVMTKPMFENGEPSEFGLRVAKTYARLIGTEPESVRALTERAEQNVAVGDIRWPSRRLKRSINDSEENE